MKKYLASLALMAALCAPGAIAARNVTAYLSYATFSSPGKGPYVETYLSVIGNTIDYKKNPDNKWIGAVEVALIFKQNDTIRASKKYVLASPLLDDSAKTVNFIDQQRIPLENGIYTLELQIADKNRDAKPFIMEQEVIVSFPNDRIMVSDIQLLESFKKSASQNVLTKNGYDLVPYVSNFYPDNMNNFAFYAEVYNAKQILGEGKKFVINYFIEGYETQGKLPSFNKFSTQTAQPVNILLAEFNIAELPNGNYNMVVEVRDEANQVIMTRKAFFQRLNPKADFSLLDIASLDVSATLFGKMNNADTLTDYIRSLRPISAEYEKDFADNVIKKGEIKLMQQYLYSFWLNRDKASPEAAWNKYNTEVMKVNKDFGTQTMRGYETDRGRVYLQYGPPNHRSVVESQPNTYPYEIWQYYKLKDQSNRKFVFYNQDLVTNNYTLLHSDAKGEIYDASWSMKLHKRTIQSNDMDMTKPGVDNFGDHTEDLFKNPR
ncbi:MAG: GWxTD domain-containing protein [Bacteroidota bacterium]